VEVGEWVATCVDVAVPKCKGVAQLFVNNLAWNGSQVFAESGGRVTVTPRPQCPPMADYNDASFCWQARASITDREVCMVIAHHKDWVPGHLRYGQVGGDDMTSRAIPIPDYPPCV
jgi:hypothetical protein